MPTNGIITEKSNGKIHIRVEQDMTACASCAAKVFCSKKDCEDSNMVLDDRSDLKIGDTVEIEEDKNILVKMALVAYGIPLVFFSAGIFLGQLLPPTKIPAELLQFACGCLGLIPGGLLGRWASKGIARRIEKYIHIKVNNQQ